MQAKQLEREVSRLTADQWGLLTTRQAGARGISRLDLARLLDAGRVERLLHGVYRLTSVPAGPLDDLRAAWLAAEPGTPAVARAQNDVVVSGPTSAWLHNIGDLQPSPYTFVSPRRRQTTREGIRYRQRPIDPADVTVVDGIPTTTVTRTIADLVIDHEDDSLTADVLRDAVAQGREPDRDRLVELLAPEASARGFAADNGAAVYAQLEKRAGTDAGGRLATLSKKVSTPAILDPTRRALLESGLLDQLAPIQELATKLNLSEQAAQLLANITIALPNLDAAAKASVHRAKLDALAIPRAQLDAIAKAALSQSQIDGIAAAAVAPGLIDSIRKTPVAPVRAAAPDADDRDAPESDEEAR